MNKEYHYTIARSDRIYLVAFVIILLGWELIKQVLPEGEKSFTYISPPSEHHGFKVKKYFNYSKNNYPKKYYKTTYHQDEKKYSSYEEEFEITPPAAPLHIMTASIDQLISMGFSKKVSFNIQKFISSGGQITNEQALLKIYGMDSTQLNKASPYIIYSTIPIEERPVVELLTEIKAQPPILSVDLNLATSQDLESLDGIGAVLAERIIKYRTSIGGFLNVSQLKECYGIPPETFEKIKNHLTASGQPHQISINEMNLDSLKHPYLNRKQIKLIQAYKKQHGAINNVSEFRKIYPPDSNWCDKVLPYISFELNK